MQAIKNRCQDIIEPIRIIGVGGLGSRMVERLMTTYSYGAKAFYIDSDASALAQFPAAETIRLVSTSTGTDLDVDATKAQFKDVQDSVREALQGASIVLVVATLGGNTGTEIAPLVVSMANEMGILAMSSVVYSRNYKDEPIAPCVANAISKFRKLKGSFISVRWYESEAVTDPLSAYDFKKIDFGLRNFIAVTADMLTYGFHSMDVEDLRYVMNRPGKARLGVGISAGNDRVKGALSEATMSISQGFPLKEAGGVFLVVTTGTEKPDLSEQKHVLNSLRRLLSDEADIVHGWNCDQSLENKIRITLLATGGPGRLNHI